MLHTSPAVRTVENPILSDTVFLFYNVNLLDNNNFYLTLSKNIVQHCCWVIYNSGSQTGVLVLLGVREVTEGVREQNSEFWHTFNSTPT